ncbi:MAG: D-lysine 5,6-aminomutase subunit alpha [Deltaproteobacteria bacterium]|nr:D-lysine 5,6-aminomutase subunit alpha [Deltaproteobacteria bacterium]
MALLPIDEGLIAEGRGLAKAIADDVQSFIARHTTVAVERTTLRFLGVDGVDRNGVPLVNIVVNALAARGMLSGGVARVLAVGKAARHLSVQETAQRIADGDAGPFDDAAKSNAPDAAQVREILEAEVASGLDRIHDAQKRRDENRARLGIGKEPLKYVIVATGNIYDDAKQGRSAAFAGADIVAVIRSTAQSLLDYVPVGATTEGFGGTWATQENFRIMRDALDDEGQKRGRYIHLTNYSSGLCMPEIAYLGAVERLDMLLNDAMYGILFRDINPRRTLIDQYISRLLCTVAGIVINTGEDNYLTTADAFDAAHTVMTSLLINEALAHRAAMPDAQMGLGHAYEIDPQIENSFLYEVAQAQLIRQVFPRAPIKWMPPTKHKTGDIFTSHVHDGLFNLTGVLTRQGIELLGMFSEAVHNPYLHDRFLSLKSASLIFNACAGLADEINWRPDGVVASRAREVMGKAVALLRLVASEGLFGAIAAGRFADVKRPIDKGKGADGVSPRATNYANPVLDALETVAGV